jgi:hypothetical protein
MARAGDVYEQMKVMLTKASCKHIQLAVTLPPVRQ